MNSSTHHSFLDRRTLIAAALAVLFGTAAAVAQSSSTYGAGSTRPSSSSDKSTTSATDDSRRQSTATADQSATSTTSSDRGPSATAATDTAGGAKTMTGRDSGKLGWMDRRFVSKAADDGMTEIQLAKLATERASNPEVKSYAQKLVDDHTQVSEELKALASQKNVKLDDEDLGNDRAHKRLSKKSGMEFDQEFVEHMIDEHEKGIKMFEKASTDAKDADLRAFASKHVDHLREHLRQAESLRSTIVPTGRIDSSATGTTSTSSSSSTTDTSRSDTNATPTTTPDSSTSSGTRATGSGTDTTRRDRSR